MKREASYQMFIFFYLPEFFFYEDAIFVICWNCFVFKVTFSALELNARGLRAMQTVAQTKLQRKDVFFNWILSFFVPIPFEKGCQVQRATHFPKGRKYGNGELTLTTFKLFFQNQKIRFQQIVTHSMLCKWKWTFILQESPSFFF